MLQNRFAENDYEQIKGDVSELKNFENESFDVVLCHNVFEYADEREYIIKEFSRILKTNGCLSILKHNRAGRVMQMVVLLNNFEHGNWSMNIVTTILTAHNYFGKQYSGK